MGVVSGDEARVAAGYTSKLEIQPRLLASIGGGRLDNAQSPGQRHDRSFGCISELQAP